MHLTASIILLPLLALPPFTTAQIIVPVVSGPEHNTKTPPSAQAQPTLKILVCGDSISQGQEFDFTWRYRLWEWFQAASTTSNTNTPKLQYVGPYNGTLPTTSQPFFSPSDDGPIIPQTSGAYHSTTNPAFTGAHFALYGRPAWQAIPAIQSQVETHQPDIVVLHLGFNDIAWWAATAADVVEHIAALVSYARLGKGDVAVLVADVSSRLLLEERRDIEGTTREVNALLGQAVREWDAVRSRVMLVRVSEEYDCHVETCPAGSDGLHPNALGEYQIARAYSKVLHDNYHFGAGPLVIPPVETIPGMETGLDGVIHEALDPLDLVFMGVALLCLVAVMVILRRHHWMSERGRAKDMYQRLPNWKR